jgi:hypothetical protein
MQKFGGAVEEKVCDRLGDGQAWSVLDQKNSPEGLSSRRRAGRSVVLYVHDHLTHDWRWRSTPLWSTGRSNSDYDGPGFELVQNIS